MNRFGWGRDARFPSPYASRPEDPALRHTLLVAILILALPVTRAVSEEASLEDLAEQSKALQAQYEYRAAEVVLREILRRQPENLSAQLGLAVVLDAVGEGAEAMRLAKAAVAKHPKDVKVLRVLGVLSVGAEGVEAGRAWFEKALAIDPDDAGSQRGMAQVALELGDLAEADRWIKRAEAKAPDEVAVRMVRALWLMRSKRLDESARILADVLKRDPWNVGANAAVAGGRVVKGSPLYRPPWTPRIYDRKIKRAAKLYQGRALDEAEARFAALDTPEAHDGRPPFFRGLVALRLEQTRDAIDFFKRAVEREPDNFLFRNGYVRAVRAHVSNQRVEYGAGADKTDRFRQLADLMFENDEIPGIEKFVRGYDELLPGEQAVVRRAVHPFRKLLPTLIEYGATHDIIGMEERITEAAERIHWREGETEDGRVWSAVRGIGGVHAATGVEFLLEARRLREDVLAHEFAHQVHHYALTDTQKFKIRRLYFAALEQGRALRPYARTNEYEYFAVAYEAFVSTAKSPWQSVPHDRAELRARDPELYDFLLELTEAPNPDPLLVRLREPVLSYYEWAGHAEQLKRVRALFEAEAVTR